METTTTYVDLWPFKICSWLGKKMVVSFDCEFDYELFIHVSAYTGNII